MRSLLKLLCFTFLSAQLHAQNNKGSLAGKLTDTTGKNPIAFATITDVVRWNAGINYLFLRDKKGQLKLSAFDLLKQITNAYRSVGENFITDVESNALTRYFMLSFTYNIRDFKGGKVGGRNNFFFF